LMMSLWDALRMNMMISYQELVRTFPSNDLNKTINLTADYYRQSDNSNDVTMGLVKGMMEVVIQEE
ncbi:hypothetical protein ACJWV3_25185, partial [Klebsiella pneumoniae]|nr:hypothetical protein [Klebsiella pneumoniae]MDS6913893.1 hypothetical protein [Klebsiella pneumoniae]MDS7038712.1 hypothetical protein [Klebsiella pneumoniae]MDS7055203.1 hypothetical protein [Klebsiella pneumoniae]MDS7072081.1 hypothetical protein [Klebsiella pneumoniae]